MKNKILYSELRNQIFESISDGKLPGRNKRHNKSSNTIKELIAGFMCSGPIPIYKTIRQVCYLLGKGEKYDEIKGNLVSTYLRTAEDASATISRFPILKKFSSELNECFESFIPACTFISDAGDGSYPAENYELQSLLSLATSVVIIAVFIILTDGVCLKNKVMRKMLISIWKTGYKGAKNDIEVYRTWAMGGDGDDDQDDELIEIEG